MYIIFKCKYKLTINILKHCLILKAYACKQQVTTLLRVVGGFWPTMLCRFALA